MKLVRWVGLAATLAAAATAPVAALAQGPTACDGGSVNTVYFTPNSADGKALADQLKYIQKRIGASGTAVVTGRIDAAERSVAGLDKSRADTVVSRLVEFGAKQDQLTASGGGVMSVGEAMLNRRVEVCVKTPPG